jgi:hypothetical protein
MLTVRYLNIARLIGRLFSVISHESGTAWYITGLLAVPPPWGLLTFSYVFTVTGEGFLIGIPLPCYFHCIK